MKVSFVEKPDKKLKSKLEGEIAGILNWALEGLARLNANDGEFTMPPSSIAKREQFGRLASGVQNFIEDCCENGEALWASEDDIYSVYEIWCDKNGSKPKPKPRLLEELVSFDPQHYDRKRKSRGGRDNEERVRAVTGLGLKVNVPAKRETKGKAGEAEIPF
jgi:putative DNA primase/helicase